MKTTSQVDSCMSCELKIIRAKNIDTQRYSSGDFFVRCFLSSGNGQRVELNTREIRSSKSLSDMSWNQSFSLDCLGSEENISLLKNAGVVVFELRWRKKFPAGLGRFGCSSKLVGKAQVPWKLCFESPNMGFEKWVFLDNTKKGNLHDDDVKPPALEISIKVKAEEIKRRRRRWSHDDECGCMDGGDHRCADYEMFALGAALEAF